MYKNRLAVGETGPIKRDEPASDLNNAAELPQEVSSCNNLPPFKERLARPCAIIRVCCKLPITLTNCQKYTSAQLSIAYQCSETACMSSPIPVSLLLSNEVPA